MRIKQGTTRVLEFFVTLAADHVTGATGLAGSLTVTIAKNGGAFAAPSGAIAEMAHGWYKLTADATDTNTVGGLIGHITEATIDTLDLKFGEVEADTETLTTGVADIQSRLPATLDSGNMRSAVKAMDTGVVTAGVIAADAIDASELAAGAVTEIQSGLATAVNLALVAGFVDTEVATIVAGVADIQSTLSTGVDANVVEWLGEAVATPTVDGVPRVEVTALMESAIESIWDAVIEGTDSAAAILRALLSGLFGKVQDFTTGTLVFKGAIDTAKTRWTVVTDASGRITSTKGNLT